LPNHIHWLNGLWYLFLKGQRGCFFILNPQQGNRVLRLFLRFGDLQALRETFKNSKLPCYSFKPKK
jgi:hypothetical protein